MKKLSMMAAISLAAVAMVSAEGLSVDGYVRAGITDTTKAPVFDTNTWMNGDYFGGGSRARLNVSYEKENGGVRLRYQKDGSFNDTWFEAENVKYCMAYANFLSGKVIAEAGLLDDRFTSTGGWEDGAFGGAGARVVVTPVENLFLSAFVTDEFAERYEATDKEVVELEAQENDAKFNEKLCSFTAAYKTDDFFVTGGVSLAEKYYGSVGFTGVKDLTVAVEAFYDMLREDDLTDDDTETVIVPWVEYTGIEKLTLGCVGYIKFIHVDAEDETYNMYTVIPAVSYAINDLVTVSAESTINIPDSDTDIDTYATITPAVTFNASEKASVTVSGTFSTDTDLVSHSITAGVKYAF